MSRLSLALTLFIGFLASSSLAQPLTLTVETGQILRHDADRVVGIDLNYLRDSDANRPLARPLNVALKDMGVRWLRYPGGGKSDFHLWSVPPYDKPHPVSLGWYATVPGVRLDFDRYVAACRSVGAEPYVVVGYSTEKASGKTKAQWLENAATWVRYANVQKKYGVHYWEIGNENWNSGKGTPEELAGVVTEFSHAMKTVDPTIQVGASGNGAGWWSRFLPLASPSLDFISLSLYNCWGWKGYDHFIQHPDEDTIGDVKAALAAIDHDAQPADRARLRVIVAETNSKDYTEGGWPGTNTLGHALVTFDTLGRVLSQPRVRSVMVWTTRWVNDTEAKDSQWYALGPANELRPTGRAVALWGQFVQPDLLTVSGGSGAVSAYAARSADGRRVTVWVLNRGLVAVDDVHVVVRAASTHYRRAAVYRLSGTGPDDPAPSWGRVGTAAVAGNAVAPFSCPGLSVTVLTLFSATP